MTNINDIKLFNIIFINKCDYKCNILYEIVINLCPYHHIDGDYLIGICFFNSSKASYNCLT